MNIALVWFFRGFDINLELEDILSDSKLKINRKVVEALEPKDFSLNSGSRKDVAIS